MHELAEALYQSIRMQLSVERYKAISVGRGANLDTIDVPLNNRRWLKQRERDVSFVHFHSIFQPEAWYVSRLIETGSLSVCAAPA